MKKSHPKKFALIGLPGSGKSTFASKLGGIFGIPVHHLDRHMFEPGGKKRDKQEFIAIQKAMLDEDAGCRGLLLFDFRNEVRQGRCFDIFPFFPRYLFF